MNGPVPPLFDRAARISKRARAERLQGDAFLAREAAEGLTERLAAVNRTFSLALDVDSLPQGIQALRPFARNWDRATIETGDAIAAEPGKYDLAVSILSLHAVNDLPGLLVQIRRALKPDGLFMAALFAGSTLTELRQSFLAAESEIKGGISPRVSPFADIRDLGGLLQRAGFALPVSDLERTIVRYRELPRLVWDLRGMGETNTLSGRDRALMPRKLLAATAAQYADKFADADGRLRATFEIAYLTGWSPHESQQQPLKPGSAKTRLADALGTAEIPLKRD
jgi:SAM-dependent methyltransferase